jgi:hypothetical protein
MILKMATEISGCKQTHWIGWPQHTNTICICWNLEVYPHEGWIKFNCDKDIKVQLIFRGMAVSFRIAIVLAWIVMPAKLVLVTHYMLRGGECISEWIWLGDGKLLIFKLKLKGFSRHHITVRHWAHWQRSFPFSTVYQQTFLQLYKIHLI